MLIIRWHHELQILVLYTVPKYLVLYYISVHVPKCSIAPNGSAGCPPTQVPASVRCRRCSGRRPRTRRSGRHRGRSAWPLGGWRPRCRTARCLLCERRGALPLGLRLLGVLPRLASRAQRARRPRVVPAAILVVPALVVRSARALRARVVPAAVLIVPGPPQQDPPLLVLAGRGRPKKRDRHTHTHTSDAF